MSADSTQRPTHPDPDDHGQSLAHLDAVDNLAWRPDRPAVLDVDEAIDGRVRGVTIKGEDVQASRGGPMSEVVLGVDPAALLALATGLLDAVRRLILNGPSDRPHPSAAFTADTQRTGLTMRAGPAGRWEVSSAVDGRVLVSGLTWSEVVHYLAASTAVTPSTEEVDG
jgi:hypothetical protein